MAWTTPRTWTTGEVPTAANFNVHVRDNFDAIGGAWTSYSPTITNWGIGNGTITGYYLKAGNLIIGKAFFTLGSTTTTSGNLVIDLPVTKLSDDGTETPFGGGLAVDTSSGNVQTLVVAHSTTTRMRFYTPTSGLVAATTPWTWTTGDKVNVEFRYEGA